MTTDVVTESAAGVRLDLRPLEPEGGFEAALTVVLERCRSFQERHEGRLARLDATGLRSLLDELGELWDDISHLSAYATLRGSEDVLDEEGQELSVRADLMLVEADELLRFVDDEWLAVPDEQVQGLLDDEGLNPYRHFLHARRRFRRYTLSPEEERALASRDGAAEEAWIVQHDRTIGSLRTTFRGRETTLSELLGQLRDPRRDVRAAALDAVRSTLEPVLPTVAHGYDTLVADRVAVDGLRGFGDARAATDLENELPSGLVDEMLDAVEQHSEVGRRWFRQKGRLLGYCLSIADELAPLELARAVPFDEALTTIVETLDSLAPGLADLAQSLVDEGRVDAEPRPGKIGTGFCMTVSRREKPYILLNYRDRPSDALKLAHEIGHAVHFMLASEAQPPLTFQPPLAVGEIAACFTQLLVADALIDAEADPGVSRTFVGAELESSLDVFRQVVLTRFEGEAYRLRAAGQPLSAARLNALWLEASRRYYGSSLELPDAYAVFWAFVGQLVRARFYNCAYVFASLTSLMLRRLAAAQADFGERYLAFLRHGGNGAPLTQLAELGIDLSHDGAWEPAFSELGRMLELLERA